MEIILKIFLGLGVIIEEIPSKSRISVKNSGFGMNFDGNYPGISKRISPRSGRFLRNRPQTRIYLKFGIMSGISFNNYPSSLGKFFENCPRAQAPSGNFQKISLGLGVIIEEIPSKSRISVNNHGSRRSIAGIKESFNGNSLFKL